MEKHMKSYFAAVLILLATVPSVTFALQTVGVAEKDGAPAKATEHTINPPKVTCSGNTLSISANNSKLGAILSQIQKCLGVQFDAPEVVKSYLVFDDIGPGPSSTVLIALLASS